LKNVDIGHRCITTVNIKLKAISGTGNNGFQQSSSKIDMLEGTAFWIQIKLFWVHFRIFYF